MLKFLDEKLLSDVRPSEDAFSRDVLIFDYHLVPGGTTSVQDPYRHLRMAGSRQRLSAAHDFGSARRAG